MRPNLPRRTRVAGMRSKESISLFSQCAFPEMPCSGRTAEGLVLSYAKAEAFVHSCERCFRLSDLWEILVGSFLRNAANAAANADVLRCASSTLKRGYRLKHPMEISFFLAPGLV